METLKDQQIASQKETIESLTKTVEKLEAELHKHTNPGSESDSTNEARSDEFAISLQNEYSRIYNKAQSAVMGLFTNYKYKARLQRDEQEVWCLFYKALFDERRLDHLWSDFDFRQGVKNVGYMLYYGDVSLNAGAAAGTWLLGMDDVTSCDDQPYKAARELVNALELLQDAPNILTEHDFNRDDLEALKMTLVTIRGIQANLLELAEKLSPKKS